MQSLAKFRTCVTRRRGPGRVFTSSVCRRADRAPRRAGERSIHTNERLGHCGLDLVLVFVGLRHGGRPGALATSMSSHGVCGQRSRFSPGLEIALEGSPFADRAPFGASSLNASTLLRRVIGLKCFLDFVVVFTAGVLAVIVLRRSAQFHGMCPPANPSYPACGNTFGTVSMQTKTRRHVLSVVLYFLRRTATSSSATSGARISSELDVRASVKPPLRHSCYQKLGTNDYEHDRRGDCLLSVCEEQTVLKQTICKSCLWHITMQC